MRSKISGEEDTCLKSYEKESLFKNFLVFFWLLEILLILLFIELYRTQKREFLQDIFKTMQVCSYTYECPKFHFEFAPKDDTPINTLHVVPGPHAFFTIPHSEKYNIKITYPQQSYYHDLLKIQKLLAVKFILATLLLMGVALYFTFYSLKPIRKALQLNDEFIKDILHDFNTPITSIVLNVNMFKKAYEDNPFVNRITRSVDTILLLQNNLKSFLQHSPSQVQKVDIAKLSLQRLEFMQNLYPNLTFVFHQYNALEKSTNPELLTRIIDNLLNNAAKYNIPRGEVKLNIIGETIQIKDTGKGMKNAKQVFERYYKEQSRGLGLGLHIVKKLADELNIYIDIDSKPQQGTTVTLDFKALKKESL